VTVLNAWRINEKNIKNLRLQGDTIAGQLLRKLQNLHKYKISYILVQIHCTCNMFQWLLHMNSVVFSPPFTRVTETQILYSACGSLLRRQRPASINTQPCGWHELADASAKLLYNTEEKNYLGEPPATSEYFNDLLSIKLKMSQGTRSILSLFYQKPVTVISKYDP
jgi:hypothetical protein